MIFSYLSLEDCLKKISLLSKQIRSELVNEHETYNKRLTRIQIANGIKINDFGLMNYSIQISSQLQFVIKRFNERDLILLSYNCFYQSEKIKLA